MLSILVRREQVDQGGQRHAGPTTEGSPYPQQRLNRTLVRDSCSECLWGGGGGGGGSEGVSNAPRRVCLNCTSIWARAEGLTSIIFI